MAYTTIPPESDEARNLQMVLGHQLRFVWWLNEGDDGACQSWFFAGLTQMEFLHLAAEAVWDLTEGRAEFLGEAIGEMGIAMHPYEAALAEFVEHHMDGEYGDEGDLPLWDYDYVMFRDWRVYETWGWRGKEQLFSKTRGEVEDWLLVSEKWRHGWFSISELSDLFKVSERQLEGWVKDRSITGREDPFKHDEGEHGPYYQYSDFLIPVEARPQPAPKREPQVYLMQSAPHDYTKIGYSTNPTTREATLQAQDPMLELIFSAPGTMQDEKELHERFKAKRIRGEWFDLSEQDIAEVKQILEATS